MSESGEGSCRGNEPIETGWLRGAKGERIVFAILAVLIWPIIAGVVIAGFGFVVWISEVLLGPPGPPVT